MRGTVGTYRNQELAKTLGASLSVVVVSSGSPDIAQQATRALTNACRDLPAQFILVSQDQDPRFAMKVEKEGAELVTAPAGSSRAEMCDLGMRHACGHIVAVRDDIAIGDAKWVDAYRAILPRREAPAPSVPAFESVVMDTQVASRAALADAIHPPLDTRTGIATIEMPASV